MSGRTRLRAILAVAADVAGIMTAFTICAVVFASVLIGHRSLARQVVSQSPDSTATVRPAVTVASGSISIDDAPTIMNGTPKVAVVEFADYQCPFCGRQANTAFPKLRQEFIDSGKVMYVYRDFPIESIHARAARASLAAECARIQGRFWDMHWTLFRGQRGLAESDLIDAAMRLGLDMRSFRGCMSGGDLTRIRADTEEGRRLGVRSTPTLFVGLIRPDGTIDLRRKIVGAQPYDVIKAAIDAVLSNDGNALAIDTSRSDFYSRANETANAGTQSSCAELCREPAG